MNGNSIESEIEKKGLCVCTTSGVSMWPMLRDRKDIVVLKKVNGRLKKYDVPLYKAYGGKYVLHRVLKAEGNSYIMRGDNCYKKEYGITDQQILGVLTAFYRDGRYIECNSVFYRIYVYIWNSLYLPRLIFIKFKGFAARIKAR